MAGRRGRRLGGRGVSHTAVGRWAREAGVGLAMGAVGARRPGGRPAQAGGVRGLGGRGRAGRGRPGRGRVDQDCGQVVARYAYECPRPPRCRRRAPGMAVRSCGAGGAGAPCGHRITGDPTRGCRGGAGRGLRLGAAGAGHDHPRAWRRGTWAALIARQVRPVPAHRVPRDPPRGGRGAGSTAGRRRRPRPGRPWPAPRSAGLDADPAGRERVVDPPGGSGPVPGQIAARLRFENPDDGGMRPCSRADLPGPVRPGRRQGARPVAGGEGPAHRTHPPHTSAPHWPDCPSPGARSRIPGRHPPVCARPRGDEGAAGGHWEGDLVIGAGGRSALITLVERTSRFVLISRLGTRHDSATVTDALKSMVADLPRAVYSTITWDQGAQMAQHAAFTAITGIPVYFADPHSPRSASHQREHRRADPRVLPQGHRLHRRHRRPGPGRPGPAQGPPTRSLERTDPHRDTGHHHQRCNHHLTPPRTSRGQNAHLDERRADPLPPPRTASARTTPCRPRSTDYDPW